MADSPTKESQEGKEDLQVKFSREAARVLHSPYWAQQPDDPENMPREEVSAFFEHLDQERSVLIEALEDAQTYDDLPPQARNIYDAARGELEYEADELIRDRFALDVPGFVFPEEAVKGRQMTQEEAHLLTQAIVEAQLSGDKETVEKLSALAQTPDKIAEAVGGLRVYPYGRETGQGS